MIVIKKATPADAATIAETGRISFIQSHGSSGPAADIEAYVANKYTIDAVREDLRATENIFHLISFQEQLAGYSKIILNVTNEYIPAQNSTCLDRLYLLQDFYDKKLGARLLEANIDISKQAGQAGMWLYTWTGNHRAVAFYTKAGFKIVGHADFKISARHSNPNYVMYLEYGTR